jgi:hypothetical protein
MASMDGVVEMVVYIITGICLIGLISALLYSIYMAVWGVYEEY